MRWINIHSLKVGMILAKNIKLGDLIIKKGNVVDEQIIQKIKEHKMLWVPIRLKDLTTPLKKEEIAIGDDMEISVSTLNLLDCSPKLIENIKNETKDLLSHVRSGKIINSKEILNDSLEYLEKITKDNEMLTYPLIAAKTYDAYTYSHLINVATLTAFLAHNIGLERKRVYNAYLGGLYHDIGKIMIPDNIIKKNGKLSEKEFEIVKQHPVKGLEIVSEFKNISDDYDDIKNIVSGHHERINGEGYPKDLFSKDLPLITKIAAVVDVYDALTTNRPYRKALHPYEASRYIVQRAGIEFDPKVANAFIKYIGIYPIGSKVVLNSGEMATVVAINKCCTLSPMVMIGDKIKDLSQDSSLFITSIYSEDKIDVNNLN